MPDEGYGNPSGRGGELAIVEAIYDAFARRDVESALTHIAPDVEVTLAGTQARVGRTEPYRGHDGVREYFADAARAWDDLALEVGRMRVAVGGVVVFGEVVAQADGRPVTRSVVWTWRVRDGMAVALRVDDLGEARSDPPPRS